MSPTSKISTAIMLVILAACTKAQDTTSQALDTAGVETSSSYNKIRDDLDLGHKPKPPVVKAPQPRYCYKTYEDIVCYAKPLPGEEYRLTGYQSASGKTGYTLPPTPVPGGADDSEPLKSVDVGSPPAVKGDAEKDKADKQLKEIIFDPTELQPKELVPDKPQ